MRYALALVAILLNIITAGYAQNVLRWETWQSNFLLSNSTAVTDPAQRNVGLHLWNDKAFGMELHYRSMWGTAIYTRNANEAIWLGNYGTGQTQQQNFNPWMTLLNGNMGIGNTNPQDRLHVEGDQYLSGKLKMGPHNSMGYGPGIALDGNLDAMWMYRYNVSIDNSELRVNIGDDGNDNFTIGYTSFQNGNWMPSVSISAAGAMSIGTTSIPSGYKLAVGGNVIAEKVRVQLQNNWPDYVFTDKYRLRPLSEVEQYIKLYHHLPEVPSADEVKKNGLDLGDNQATLLKKLEELTLYVIAQDKRNEEQHQRLEQQAKILKQQQDEIETLKKRIQ